MRTQMEPSTCSYEDQNQSDLGREDPYLLLKPSCVECHTGHMRNEREAE